MTRATGVQQALEYYGVKLAVRDRVPQEADEIENATHAQNPTTTAFKGMSGMGVTQGANTLAEYLATRGENQTGVSNYGRRKNFRRLSREMGLPDVDLRNAPAAQVHGADNLKYVRGPRGMSEAFAAHELGHIKNWRAVDRLISGGHQWGMIPIGALANASAYTALPLAAQAASDPTMSWAPGLLQAGLLAPKLIDEGGASGHALRHLIKKYGLRHGLSRGKNLLPAFASYGTIALSPLAITGARRAYNQLNAEERT